MVANLWGYLVMLGIAFAVTQGYLTVLSCWAFLVSLLIALVWFVPLGIVKAATDADIGLNVITESVVAYYSPDGRWR